MIITTADKLNIITWAFSLLSVLLVLLIALSWYRKKRLSFLNIAAILLVLVGMALFIDAYWIEPNWIATEEVIIHDQSLADVLEGIKVVQISDIHLQEGIGYRERELVKKVNALKPDLLFITGDLFSDQQKKELPVERMALMELVSRFSTTFGIFGVPGNYDRPLYDSANIKEFKNAGIDFIYNESRKVALPNNKILYLAGFDTSQNKRANLLALRNIPKGAPVILLAHASENFGEAIAAGVNLFLVGHTHGGQIGIPYLINRSNSANKSSFMEGLFDAGKTKMYVNRGIGTTGIPVRFLCRPEITVFEIRK